MRRNFATISSALLAIAVAGCSGSSSAGHVAAHRAAAHVTITSSIKDGAALSAPTTWEAMVGGVPDSDHVTAVTFLIDGKKSWTSEFAPYSFNMDGYPFWPWLMGTGAHVLTAQATTAGGLTASASAHVVITGKPRSLPASLVGSYHRTVSTADLTRTLHRQGIHIQAGSFTMQIRDGLFIWESAGVGANEVAVSAGPHQVQFKTSANWLAPRPDAGGFCEAPEAPARYSWSLSGSRLTLRPASPDDCANRDAVLTGTWVKGG